MPGTRDRVQQAGRIVFLQVRRQVFDRVARDQYADFRKDIVDHDRGSRRDLFVMGGMSLFNSSKISAEIRQGWKPGTTSAGGVSHRIAQKIESQACRADTLAIEAIVSALWALDSVSSNTGGSRHRQRICQPSGP